MDRESEAIHDVILWLDEPAGIWRVVVVMPEEVAAFVGTVERFTGMVLDVLEGDLAVLIGDGVFFTDDAPVEVGREILQGGETFSDTGAVDDPFSGNPTGNAVDLY